jgi:mono/diheme cytochrome c family protein
MPTARFFVSSFALSATALLWLAGHPRVLAQQNAAPAHTPDQSTILPLDGAKIFRSYCASCHGVNGSGDGPVAAALRTKVPALTTLARRNHGAFPAARVRRIIAGDEDHAAHGSREMPI